MIHRYLMNNRQPWMLAGLTLTLALVACGAPITSRATFTPTTTTTHVTTSTPTSTPLLPPTPLPLTSTLAQAGLPAFDHIFLIILENKDARKVAGNPSAPYINELASQYGSATQYYGVTHPSLPNYLALTGGDTFGIASDCTDCFVNEDNLADQIEASGRSWKAYLEAMPSPCFLGNANPLYKQKHNPFIYYDSIRTDPKRCGQTVPLDQLANDLNSDQVPDFVWITPDMCNDMHDCPVETGDAWLKLWVSQILASKAWQQDSVLFITFDEGKSDNTEGCCTYAAGGRVVTLVISPYVPPGFKSDVAYSHYSLLRTIEVAWGLPLLGKADCACTLPMTDFFQAAPAP